MYGFDFKNYYEMNEYIINLDKAVLTYKPSYYNGVPLVLMNIPSQFIEGNSIDLKAFGKWLQNDELIQTTYVRETAISGEINIIERED